MTSRELYYDVAKSHIQSQDAQHRDLETKSLRYTTASLTITGLLVTLLLSTGVQIEGWNVAPAVAVAVSVMVSAVLTFLTLWTRDFDINPRLDDFAEYLNKDEDLGSEYWLQWVGKAMRMAYEQNERIIKRKANLILWNQVATLVLLSAGLVLACSTLTADQLPVSVYQV